MATGKEVIPRPAATVVLVRSLNGEREVFLTKRPDTMDFLGGFYVFPGGRVDGVDRSREARERVIGFEERDFTPQVKYEEVGEILDAGDSVSPVDFYTAGIRELFEESGVLLLCDGKGEIVSGDVYEEMRKSSIDLSSEHFLEQVVDRGFYYAAFSLSFLQLFITPPLAHQRFYTIFFTAILPEGQRAGIETGEVSESFWISPKKALERGESGEFPMIYPTMLALISVLDV
ncbi:MAG: NUDIX domain-containing protein [Deltaproteobacteria bacterium]|uniref:NUDIX domain-containing protein n=1 Tax=Candidatus Zymogenus saltonus TaxID=2844893 RepID=A0A9D8KCV6_9DELT|nr:NUDIX domain-containing protein [Candidatus Zymogenus saltonus]